MPVNYTQYIDGVRVSREIKSGSVPGTIRTKVHDLTDVVAGANINEFEAIAPNYISKVKCVGTINEAITINITHMDDTMVLGVQMEESDEMNGPFRKIQLSGSQPAGTVNSTAMIWEVLVG